MLPPFIIVVIIQLLYLTFLPLLKRLVLFYFSQPDTTRQLLKRIEILETHQKGDIEAQITVYVRPKALIRLW